MISSILCQLHYRSPFLSRGSRSLNQPVYCVRDHSSLIQLTRSVPGSRICLSMYVKQCHKILPIYFQGPCGQLTITTDPYGLKYSDYHSVPVNFCENCSQFPLLIFKCSSLSFPVQNLIILFKSREPNSVAVLFTIISGLRKSATTELIMETRALSSMHF